MLVCAFVGIGIMLSWIMINPMLFKEEAVNSKTLDTSSATKAVKPPRFVFLPIVLIMLGIILQGILRDGVQNWMPFYLSESFGIQESAAITSTVMLAVFSILSTALFNFIHTRFFKNEVFCAVMIFALSIGVALILYLVSNVLDSAFIPMVLMSIIVASMHGVNLMLITVAPKRFAKSGRVATYSGILNACTYIGAALSTYGFAVLAENFGWNFTILMWVFVSAAGCAVCFLATPWWKKFRKEYSDNPEV